MYRGPNGLKCAVGHLISDDDYNPLFEGAPALDLPLISAHFGAYRKLIQSLQAAHDGNAYHYAGEHILRTVNMTPDLLEQRLSAVAAAFGLKIPVDIRPGA
jgi:hypothetical protein